jgi:hypothetical protein
MSGFLTMSLIPFALLGLAIPYAVLKMRDARAEEHDPEIGLKSALYYIFSLSILLILLGLTILVVDALKDTGSKATTRAVRRPGDFDPSPPPPAKKEFNQAQRTGAAFMVSGFAVSVFHLVLIFGFTNDRAFPAAKRVFVGWRFAICALTVLVAFTVLVWQVFQEDVKFDDLKEVLGVLLVWAPAWLVHLVLMRVYGGPQTVGRGGRPAVSNPYGD